MEENEENQIVKESKDEIVKSAFNKLIDSAIFLATL